MSAPAPSARPRWRLRAPRLGKVLLYGVAAAIAGALITTSWWWSCGWQSCPTPQQLQAWRPTEGGTLLARDSAFVSALSPVRRVNVPLSRVPRHVTAAFIAVEDRRFHEHHGVDWYGVARAMVSNVRAGGVREGASTITMQLARNVFLGNRAAERSFGRKFLEWRYAGLLEAALSKDDILERYLNAIYLGNGVYGVEAASRDLFGKSIAEVTLSEAAMLAGLPKAPSSYSPRNSRKRALARRAIVFGVLERERIADAGTIEAARRAPFKIAKREFVPTRPVDSWAVEAVRVVLDSLRTAGVIPRALNDAQLRVWTTIDRRAQLSAERAIAAGAAAIDDERRWGGFDVRGENRTQGALVALDPMNGAVRAIVGGRRVERKGFNRALRAQRQPGSTFKPFVYAAALQQGFTPATMVEDQPVEIDTGNDVWRPSNYGDSYSGRITLRDALNRSANAATVRVSRDVGVAKIAALARAQGITSDLPIVPALALGAASVTPMEITTAYAAFANGGARVVPYLIDKVEDPFGRVLWQAPPRRNRTVLAATDAFLVTSLLQSVVDRGTGRPVRDAGVRGPVAGKTGTTNDGADVWFVGYTPSLVASVWLGADRPQPLGWNASGGRLAAPVWARFLRDGWRSPEEDIAWTAPAGIETKQIDVGTGKLASDWCGPSRREFFKTGTMPTTSCENEVTWAMRDAEPPDWHEDTDGTGTVDPEMLGNAVEAVLEATQANEQLRAVSGRVMREIRRAAERERQSIERDRRNAERQQRNLPRAPAPPAAPVPPRN
ncbi:penicillin-binding protein 1A [Gemmatimonas phototrophica]|uniref:penicillin-binding protein 1A n=1 Tax=Gemmatimonas phototrophica TaxID=1379270 RepID=UPI0006A6A4F5|nr:PBP1A family penicillin-binding protein [Gemmatimonas phototrophica]